MSFYFEDLKVDDPSDMMEIEEQLLRKTMKSLIHSQEGFLITFFLHLILMIL